MNKAKYFIIIPVTIMALWGLLNLSYRSIYVYPITDKLETYIDINKRGYNPMLKYVKIKGITTNKYELKSGFFLGIIPKVFFYNDSLLKKKVFYIDSTGVVWIFHKGQSTYKQNQIHRGDCLEKDFGELEFKKIWQCD